MSEEATVRMRFVRDRVAGAISLTALAILVALAVYSPYYEGHPGDLPPTFLFLGLSAASAALAAASSSILVRVALLLLTAVFAGVAVFWLVPLLVSLLAVADVVRILLHEGRRWIRRRGEDQASSA